jgi:hypothetical protein
MVRSTLAVAFYRRLVILVVLLELELKIGAVSRPTIGRCAMRARLAIY